MLCDQRTRSQRVKSIFSIILEVLIDAGNTTPKCVFGKKKTQTLENRKLLSNFMSV